MGFSYMTTSTETWATNERLRQMDALERAGAAIARHIGKLEDGIALLDRPSLKALADRLDLSPHGSSQELRARIRYRVIGARWLRP